MSERAFINSSQQQTTLRVSQGGSRTHFLVGLEQTPLSPHLRRGSISHDESESLALVTSRNGNRNRSKDLVRRAAARRVNQVRRGESSVRACRVSDLSRLACDKLTPSTATTVTHTHILLEPVLCEPHLCQGHARASRFIKLYLLTYILPFF